MVTHRAIRYVLMPAFVAALLLIGVAAVQANDPSHGSNPGPTRPSSIQDTAAVTPVFQPSPVAQTFVPINPCRIVNTSLSGGKVAARTTRSFYVSGGPNVQAQGGHSGGCSAIPATATAVAVTMSAINVKATGWLTAWPAGLPRPTAYALRFAFDKVSSTGLTVEITPGTGPGLSVYADAAKGLDLIVDVTGYYEPQTHLIILSDGTVWYGNATHVTAVTHTAGSGSYVLTLDRPLDGCNVLTSDNDQRNAQAVAAWGGTQIQVSTSAEANGIFTTQDESFQLFLAC